MAAGSLNWGEEVGRGAIGSPIGAIGERLKASTFLFANLRRRGICDQIFLF